MDKLLSLEERVIDNSKTYMRDFITKIEEIVTELKDRYSSKYSNCISLEELIEEEFKGLENSLNGVVDEE